MPPRICGGSQKFRSFLPGRGKKGQDQIERNIMNHVPKDHDKASSIKAIPEQIIEGQTLGQVNSFYINLSSKINIAPSLI